MSQPPASDSDKSFLLAHFSTSELFEMASDMKPREIEEEVGVFLRRRLGEAIVLEEQNEKESDAMKFLDTFSG